MESRTFAHEWLHSSDHNPGGPEACYISLYLCTYLFFRHGKVLSAQESKQRGWWAKCLRHEEQWVYLVVCWILVFLLQTAWSLPLCLKSCFSGHSNNGTHPLRPPSKSSKTDITREVVLAQWFTFTKMWMKGKVSEKWSYLLSGSLTLQYEWRERFQRSGPTCSVVHLHW